MAAFPITAWSSIHLETSSAPQFTAATPTTVASTSSRREPAATRLMVLPAGLLGKTHHSVKSPACSCVSITLPAAWQTRMTAPSENVARYKSRTDSGSLYEFSNKTLTRPNRPVGALTIQDVARECGVAI